MELRITHDRDRRELRRWLDFVVQLPLARMNKVHSVREALRSSRYEHERMIDETVDRLSRDVGIHALRS